MNLNESVYENNSTTVEPPAPHVDPDWARILAFKQVFLYVCMALGIPGSILSAIVWLKLHKKNSSAVYLAAIAFSDIIFLLSRITSFLLATSDQYRGFFYGASYLVASGRVVEPLLVLGFSVERLLAICWPLQVRGSSVSYSAEARNLIFRGRLVFLFPASFRLFPFLFSFPPFRFFTLVRRRSVYTI